MANFRLWVDKTYKDGQRMDFFKSFTEGKKVLHVGLIGPKPDQKKIYIWHFILTAKY